MPAPGWPQPPTDSPPLRKTRDAEPDTTAPDEKKPDDEQVEVKPASDSETAKPVALPPPPAEPIVAQEVPNPPPPPEPPPPPAAEAAADTPADERTPCEIAADELPQVGG
jgi:hypothetical protein